MAPGDRWGPFAADLEPAERLARLRALRALVRVLCGPRGVAVEQALLKAEVMPSALEVANVELMALGSIDRRRVLSSYAGLAANTMRIRR